MTKHPTLALSRSRDIPFNKLVLSQANVRKTKAGVSIEELAEDIAHRTLLQSLNVRPVLDAGGAETGMFEVPAGGRRYRALSLLVKQKRLARNALVPCVVRTDGLAEEDSLAENTQRAPLHALDQFRAFQAMAGKGLSEEEIAAAFFTTSAVVRQRLRLAAVAPALLEVYGEDGITLDQLMAFTVNPDHDRQAQVWEAIQKTYNREPYTIRRMLTEGAIRASDRRAQFVLDAYVEAGGPVMRDLFEADHGGWLRDPGLVERLVLQRLEQEAQTLSDEGWKWVETAIDFPYGHTSGLRHLTGQPAPLSDEEAATISALQAEYKGYEDAQDPDGDYPEAVDLRLGEIEAALEALQDRPTLFDPAEMAIAGAFLSIDTNGQLRIARGYVLPEDEPPVIAEDVPEAVSDPRDEADGDADGDTHAAQTGPGAPSVQTVEDESPGRPLPDRLVAELTAHRSLALRDALANQPEHAFLAVLHAMVLGLFYAGRYDSCLEIAATSPIYNQQAAGLAETPCAVAISARHATWTGMLPKDATSLWEELLEFDSDSRQALFAHCAGQTVNALVEGWNKRQRAIAHADQLAQLLALDMTKAGWAPTAETYLGRVTKGQILQAVREAKGEAAATPLETLRKDDMVAQAEQQLARSGWLPAILRTAPAAEGPELPASQEAQAEAAPAQSPPGSEDPSHASLTGEALGVNGGETAMAPDAGPGEDEERPTDAHPVAAE
ncbi:DNA-binding protein [Caulobacter vibrioides]|nr:DNA-binding protein [Caulobacter vibrioides]